MIISLLRDHFITRYKLECLKKKIPEIDLSRNGKIIAMMIYDAVNEIQSRLGVIESSEVIPLVAGTNQYELEHYFGEPKVVSCNNIILEKRSTDWISKRNAIGTTTDTPTDYAIIMNRDIYLSTLPNILLYPTPNIAADLAITFKSNSSLFDPTRDEDAYSTNYPPLPESYDKAILFYMVDSMFDNIRPNFEREMIKLKVTQFNGEKFDYHYD